MITLLNIYCCINLNTRIDIAAFKENDPSIQRFFDEASGYVVIPTVGKGGFGIGGARGKGVFYESGTVTAVVTLTQLSFGFQWGGQAYSEFNSGMAIFTQAKGGLMYEASVGGQKFKAEPKE